MRFRIRFPTDEIRKKAAAAQQDLRDKAKDILEVLGVRLLSFAQLDYRTKARGGTGTDGIKWKPLAEETIRAKNRRGKRNAKRKTTKTGKARPGGDASEIGVNTGLQRASAAPGFRAGDGQGGNVFELDNTSVTVGYGREYSEHFDKDRPLLPNGLPDAWAKELEVTLGQWGDETLKARIETA